MQYEIIIDHIRITVDLKNKKFNMYGAGNGNIEMNLDQANEVINFLMYIMQKLQPREPKAPGAK